VAEDPPHDIGEVPLRDGSRAPADCERNDTDGGEASGEPTIAEVPETATVSTPLAPFGTIIS
jgi:hypothetical protein